MKETSINQYDLFYIEDLASKIEKYQKSYYTGEAEISDEEFDALWDELKKLEPSHPLLQKIGSDLSDSTSAGGVFEKAKHLIPMGSQEKAANPEEFLKWAAKHVYEKYLVEYKLDGASLELQYKNGVFHKAVTRGDGIEGDDITKNVLKMKGVVQKLDGNFTGGVRGEVIMSHEVHEKYFSDKANCRNAANGLMKRKDGEKSEFLQVICYDAFFPEVDSLFAPFKTELEKILWLKKCGFETVPVEVFDSAQSVIDYRATIMEKRKDLPFDIDGLVIKNNEIDTEDAKRNRPDKQIAFKFSLEEAVSVLRNVIWNENGATYTPVAEFDSVRLAGTNVTHASLANPNTIKELGIKIGSHVVVTKRGEIIPKIESCIKNSDDSVLSEIQMPTVCETCGETLTNEGTRLFCPNKNCPKRLLHQIKKWVSVLDIRNLGDTLIKSLFDSKTIQHIKDIYQLTEEKLTPHFLNKESIEKEKKSLGAKKVLVAIEKSRTMELSSFIAGFDIEDMGVTKCEKLIAAGFTSLEKFLSATQEEIQSVDGFADVSAKSLIQGLEENKEEMLFLVQNKIISINEIKTGGSLVGKSFCFTGELKTLKRAAAEKLVKEKGGSCKSSVTKDLSFLVTNDTESGSSKNKKAAAFGIPIIDENAFLELINEK